MDVAATGGPTIRNISDTALWVAVYRARETERPDAVFRDPLAGRLAGERGEQIARSMAFGEKHSWSYVARTWRVDRMIEAQVRDGVDMVINLAAGLDARPYYMDLPKSLKWVEVDLPPIIDYKAGLLRGEKPHCDLERVSLDLSDVEARQKLFQRLGSEARKAFVISEGIIVYLNRDDVSALARDLARQPSFRGWVVDMCSPGLLKMLQKQLPGLKDAGSPLKFGPEEGPEFFVPSGWKPVEVYSLLHTAAKIKRLPSLLMRFFALFPESNGRQGSRPWGGVVRLSRM
jgi:methyltransferase (TIGR00027 family)